ncbi:MAG: hypothetical protein ACI94Y_002915 [Maribacter sp.]|jgi:hypothetical protein
MSDKKRRIICRTILGVALILFVMELATESQQDYYILKNCPKDSKSSLGI